MQTPRPTALAHCSRMLVTGFVAIWLAACAPTQKSDEFSEAPPPPETPAPQPVKPAVQKPVPKKRLAAQTYAIDAAATDIQIYVYRTGNLAIKGHNYIITSRDVRGAITRSPDWTGSRFDLEIPVETLIVDDPKIRAAAGKEFASKPTQQQFEGTRKSMLGERVLNAATYPAVRVAGTVVEGKPPKALLEVEITLHGMTRKFRTPAVIEHTDDRISATGAFSLRQTEFGIQPISLLGGALRVEDELQLKYKIVGRNKP